MLTREEGHGLGTHRHVVLCLHVTISSLLIRTVRQQRAEKEVTRQLLSKYILGNELYSGSKTSLDSEGQGGHQQDKCSEEVPAAQLEGWVGTRMWK